MILEKYPRPANVNRNQAAVTSHLNIMAVLSLAFVDKQQYVPEAGGAKGLTEI